ncbi:hypothetical protein [Eupransor demetentiae]|uniref:Uncharacterized protein n=1 Tax=Eupransor demetentiae TaxID=3109584 RepID=A0ABM9N6B2_9LACO|nr:hypothetical protein R54876_GBNLAHCA_01065 [Lactobacillaceae bacterium LMG 33000]
MTNSFVTKLAATALLSAGALTFAGAHSASADGQNKVFPKVPVTAVLETPADDSDHAGQALYPETDGPQTLQELHYGKNNSRNGETSFQEMSGNYMIKISREDANNALNGNGVVEVADAGGAWKGGPWEEYLGNFAGSLLKENVGHHLNAGYWFLVDHDGNVLAQGSQF